eukprot:6206627-Pleurochrysis_carterae.AAC.1
MKASQLVKENESCRTVAERRERQSSEAGCKANKTIEGLESKLDAAREQISELQAVHRAEQMPSAPKAHSPNSFEALSDAGKCTVRFRAIQYAEQLLSQHDWRDEDLITVVTRLGLMEALFECREIWAMRMQ